jgi:glycosyltransferase involved in cell wall biosynthesis
LPVISTNCTGAAVEFIETGRNGWLICASDENALYMAMREAAVLSSEELAALSRSARESVSTHNLAYGAERFIQAAHEAVENWRF